MKVKISFDILVKLVFKLTFEKLVLSFQKIFLQLLLKTFQIFFQESDVRNIESVMNNNFVSATLDKHFSS